MFDPELIRLAEALSPPRPLFDRRALYTEECWEKVCRGDDFVSAYRNKADDPKTP